MADKGFIESALKAHNDYRKKHSAPPLKHNKEISAIAQKWADELAAKDGFQHSQNRDYKGGKMGENIAMKWTSSGDDYTGPEPVAQWYDEVERYNYETASGPRTGHFTQVVWVNSKEVGFGKAQSSSGKWLVVANYYPAGNFIGQYKENVLQPGTNLKKSKNKKSCIIL